MNINQLIRSSLSYHWRMNLAVALGVLAGTAVLTGALLVGDSVRGSLTHLALDGLGTIEHTLVVDKFFRVALAENVKPAAPAILLQSTLTQPDAKRRADRVTILGCDQFDKLGGRANLAESIAKGEIILNEPLARALNASAGQDVIVRLPVPSDVPRDSPLGRKTETTSSVRLRVKAVIPADGLGRFSLHPNQVAPLNAFVGLEELQNALQQEGKANAIFVTERNGESAVSAAQKLTDELKPSLADLGLFVQGIKRTSDQGEYLLIGSKHMLLDAPANQAADKLVKDKQFTAQPILTYLANYIKAGPSDRGKVAYSTITALDPLAVAPLGPFVGLDGKPLTTLPDDTIVITRWLYDDLAKQGVMLQPGDALKLEFFEPESTHGKVLERTVSLRLHAVVDLAGAVADRDFTPELKGVTDEDSIADWNPPFPYDPKRVRTTKPNDVDEQYWDTHRATPKAFVSLATGRKLWESRFGRTTAIRVAPQSGVTAETLADEWRAAIDTAAVGFAFRPVRAQALQAATGTTPFNLLFLGFSMFIIAAAVMLVALLFRLAVERRAREIGILLATGWSQRLVRRLLIGEGTMIATVGGVLGVAAGVAYAWLMLAGLRTWWVAAVSAPFLQLHVTGVSLVIGGLCGVGVSLLAVIWALRNLRGASARQLMSGNTADESRAAASCRGGSLHVARGSLVGAIALTVVAFRLQGEAQAGAFFGAGGLVLTALLCFVWRRLVLGGGAALVDTRGTTGNSAAIVRLALRNAARHPSRSTLTIGLVASAAFLIMAISAFHLEPPSSLARRDTGTGGFALVGESSLPLLLNLNDEDGRFDLGFSDAAEKSLTGTTIFPLRAQPGDDASCLNLYQPQQPRVLGISPQLVERGGFEWAGHAGKTEAARANPWTLLTRSPGKSDSGGDVVPVVIDMATAMFSLHLSGVGSRFDIRDDRGATVTLEVVGLLKNSIFQGRLLIAEDWFLRHFPDVAGYQFFLIDTPAEQTKTVADTLNGTLGDYGLSVRGSAEILSEFLAVQNTYLSTFQSLGGLGLLLGTLGLATVQLRNVLERRGELALLRATGFRQSLLARLVFYENAALLVGGLTVGALAALLAILPHLLSGGAAIPWQSLGLTLGAVIVVGLIAGMAAVRAVLNTPVLEALRGE